MEARSQLRHRPTEEEPTQNSESAKQFSPTG
jgi:hypothetical protein